MLTFNLALCFDTETTSVPDFTKPADDPSQPRLCSLNAALIGPGYGDVREIDMMVQPDGWEIPASATAVNGLTQAMLLEGGSPIEKVLDAYNELLDECDLIVCFSANFDLKILRGEQRRAGRPDRYGEKPVCDIIWACRSACKGQLPPGVKSVNLNLAHEIMLGAPFENPHVARNDRLATTRLFKHLNEKGLVTSKVQKSHREEVAA